MIPLEWKLKIEQFFPFIKTRGLTYKFIRFTVLTAVVPTSIIAISLFAIEWHTLKKNIYTHQLQTTQRVADRVSLHINNVRSIVSLSAQEPGLAGFTRQRQEESLQRLMHWQPSVKEAAILDISGRETAKMVIVGDKIQPATILLARRNRAEITRSLRDKVTVIGTPFFGNDYLPYVFAACPTYGRKGTLIVKVSIENLWTLLQRMQNDQSGELFIVDGNGNLLAHPDVDFIKQHRKILSAPLEKALKSGARGLDSYGIYPNQNGKKAVTLIEPIENTDWTVILQVPVWQAYASLRSMQKEIIKWTLLCVITVIFVTIWQIRKILHPIRILQRGAESVARGNLNLNLDIHTGDELEQLARAFEQMSNSLKEMEVLRHDLISMLVHDLKNPLSAIMGGIDYMALQKQDQMTETQKKILNITRKSTEELNAMIQNLLDVAKMEEGKLELNGTNVSIQTLLKECVDPFRIQAKREAKVLTVDTDNAFKYFHMDQPLMRRVINNLIANAVRHTPAGGRIHVYAHGSSDTLRLVVEDNGEGIPLEYQEKIFSKFVQAQRKHAHLRSGTGLGLTFCKMVVELHQGKITVQSQAGKGSAFIIELPVLKPENTLL